MKSKLLTTPLLVLSLLILSPDAAPAQNGPPPPHVIAAPGQPPAAPALPGAVPNPAFQGVDPNTGLPVAVPDWKDPNWDDPIKVVTNLTYPSLPIKEIANDLSKLFNFEFDVLLPENFGAGRPNSQPVNWMETQVTMSLQNVKASEIFNAMNLVFENNRTPLRWELKMNGKRRTVLLRVLEAPELMNNGLPETKHVFFVGDLVEGGSSTGLKMPEIVRTVSEVWNMAYATPFGAQDHIKFHEKAQLVIVSGSPDQISFVQQTLAAMEQKVNDERRRRAEAAVKPKNDDPKPGGAQK